MVAVPPALFLRMKRADISRAHAVLCNVRCAHRRADVNKPLVAAA
jgi:hypothetical protein